MMKIPLTLGTSILLFAYLMLSGCEGTVNTKPEPKPASFYTLNSTLEVFERPTAPLADEGLAIGIGPVRFPAFLDRPEIVSRTPDSQLQVDESHRWGGSLKDDFLRVLSENLSQLLGTSRILVEPTEARFPLDFQVIADVLKFEGKVNSKTVDKTSTGKDTKSKGAEHAFGSEDTESKPKSEDKPVGNIAGSEATFKVRWAILDVYQDQTLMTKESTYRSTTSGPGPGAMVVALSKTLTDFSRDLAEQLHKLAKEKKKKEKKDKKEKKGLRR